MKLRFINTLLLFVSLTISSQTVEPSSAVDKHNLQVELESLYTNQKESSETMKSWSIPSVLFRYGLFNGVELQLNAPIIKEKLYENDHLIHSLHKFDDMQLGVSIDLWKQQSIIPEVSIMLRAILPISLNLKKEHVGKVVSLNLSNSLNEKLSFNYNIGYVNETNNSSTCFYIANFNYDLNSKFHIFIEEFADFSNSAKAFHNINTGFGYALNDKFCLDLSIAKGMNHNMFYVGGIFTYNFKLKH
jgi:hypothetical protein